MNRTLIMIDKNITCSATNPQPVTLPFIIDDKLIDVLHTHYYVAGQREQRALSHEELESLKHETLMGSMTIKSHVFFFLWKSSSRPLQSKQMWYKGIYVSTYGKSVFAQEEEKCVMCKKPAAKF